MVSKALKGKMVGATVFGGGKKGNDESR